MTDTIPLDSTSLPTAYSDTGDMPVRFTDYRVPDPGIRDLFTLEARWESWLHVEAALAGAQARLGIIPTGAATEIAAQAHLSSLDVVSIRRGIAATSHPLMALITELSRATGEEHGGWVHWGATTQNITQSGDVLQLKQAHVILTGQLQTVLSAAAALARKGATAVMAGRTHSQQAVPITFGFKVAVWIDELLRHQERLAQLEPRVFTAMAGGAVGSFASLGRKGPEVQRLMAADLGLGSMRIPSRGIGDQFAEYVTVLALLAATGGRIAGEIYNLMRPEIAEAREASPGGTVGSSTMPHKQNPQLSQDVLTISAQIRANVPLALEAMLQDQEVNGANTAMMDDALSRSVILTGDMLARLHIILSQLDIDEERMRANLEITHGLISSEAVMLSLGHVIGRQHAHDVVYESAQEAIRTGRQFGDVVRNDPAVTAHLGPEQIDELLDPLNHVGLCHDMALEAAGRAEKSG
ncbi:adenylosuccinate lyase family protein [Arthrobacter sp. AK01]|uniref:class-II fumarase/aspartase family protein n=1 Tax=Micrococcaceae TaxID=1268 RepID=UPI001E4C4B8B|nr:MULTISPECIES: adenylosuccinate lyase family protein [Micrococcaceae]MCD4851736.1 adenylosuccinate lyase family protein [Arthrobacter sp. AK01]MCP1411910.1 adenylosuccinate lyase [Paenarthrobacter sp. A20]